MKNQKYFNVTEIDPHTWCIEEKRLNQQCLLYLLEGEKKGMLIDTGYGFGDVSKVVHTLTSKPVFVVNTHAHLDHIGGNHYFQDIYVSEADREIFKMHTDRAVVEKLLDESIPKVLKPFLKNFRQDILNQKISGNYHWFEAGKKFELGGRTIETIATPGHTPGSIVLVDKDRGYLFSGDTICTWGVLLHLDGCCDVDVYYHSLMTLKERADEWQMIWPGHHEYPVDNHLLDEYITCAKKMIEHPEKVIEKDGHKEMQSGTIKITKK